MFNDVENEIDQRANEEYYDIPSDRVWIRRYQLDCCSTNKRANDGN